MLPERLLQEIGGPVPIRANSVIILVSVDPSGHPRPSLLSPYQVAADRATQRLLVAVHAGTQTERNLRERGKAALVVFSPPSAIYVQGEAAFVGENSGEALYRLRPSWVKEDRSDEAPIVGAPLFDDTGVKGRYARVFLGLWGGH